ncbi:MAG: DNA methyltransferase [Cyanobacteria bacterium MAG CAR2_bin_4]|nr:DNA methyltransferase [Cyanobacteria bacterium MAG CAR2_bin_4]
MAANFAPSTIWTGDNLPVLRGMNSACVDLIYLDPPFNSNRTYKAPIGSKAAGASFKDAWTLDDVDVCEHGELADRNSAAYAVIEAARLAHGKGMQSYLVFMAVRLLEMHRVLKPTGSIYLHCDPTASHYLKLLMDGIFGKGQFRNEIIWSYRTGGVSKNYFARKHDVLFYYSGGLLFNMQTEKAYTKSKSRKPGLVNYGAGKAIFHEDDQGVYNLVSMRDIWEIPYLNSQAKERLGYPTQKPLALLDRIIKASSNPGDLVLDPFCGCATALVAADRLRRQWAGIDLSPLAVKLVKERIVVDPAANPLWAGPIALDTPPKRTDLGNLANYRTHRHRLYGEQEGVCPGCNTHFPFRVMDVDHILPRSKGGTDHPDNLQLLCSGCNRSKGGKTMAEWRAAQRST